MSEGLPTTDARPIPDVVLLPCGKGVVATFSAAAPGRTSPNEDTCGVFHLPGGAVVLVVADGLGGQRSGDVASQLIVERLRTALGLCEVRSSGSSAGTLDQPSVTDDAALPAVVIAEAEVPRSASESPARDGEARGHDHAAAAPPPPSYLPFPTLTRVAILEGIESANRELLDRGIGAASTVAIVEMHGQTARTYHVGDSMILAVGQRGKVKLQSVSHSPIGFAVESGMLDAAAAMHHAERHVVSNVVGAAGMRIEMGTELELAPLDTVLIASDGLFDNLHVPEIIDLMRTGPADHAVRALALAASRRMRDPQPGDPSKPDDLTIVLYRPTCRETSPGRKRRGAKSRSRRSDVRVARPVGQPHHAPRDNQSPAAESMILETIEMEAS
ncbi:MAG: protein phosphatase 2C domain-containing protein [Planctomycetaceae bacterium]